MDLLKTALHDVHVARGARMVPFAGYHMPVQYEGVMAEHKTIRTDCGLFDVSHMGEVIVEGAGALEGLQWVLSNDLSKLVDGQALYTVMCQDNGGIVDDLIVYREAADRYFLCINASRRHEDVAHLKDGLEKFDCALTDVSDAYSQIALQGPKAEALLSKLAGIQFDDSFKAFFFKDLTVAGCENVRVARTGYTGEDGVELYVANADAVKLWEALEDAGSEFGIKPCGLGARDTLRLEMKYALYGNDIDLEHNPIEAGLGWVVKLKKGEFRGSKAIEAYKAGDSKRKLVGFKMIGRGIPRQGYGIEVDGQSVGNVTSGTHSPSLGEAIGMGYVSLEHSKVGTRLEVVVRGKAIEAEVVSTPFYKRD